MLESDQGYSTSGFVGLFHDFKRVLRTPAPEALALVITSTELGMIVGLVKFKVLFQVLSLRNKDPNFIQGANLNAPSTAHEFTIVTIIIVFVIPVRSYNHTNRTR